MPKQLIPVANQPVICHVLNNLREIGVTEVGVVVGDRRHEIEAVVGDGRSWGAKIRYIQQDRPSGLAHCVSVSRDFLGDDDFVMYLGDTILADGIGPQARRFREERPVADLLVHKVADPRAFGVVEVDPDGRVTRLVEKPAEPRSDLALTGVYFFTSSVHEAVAAIGPSERGELEITDAVQWLVTRGDRVDAHVYSGFWRDTGRIEDVLACNRELLEAVRPRILGEVDPTSLCSGPVVVEAGARVTGSRLTGPLIVAAGSVVHNSTIGPYTAIDRDCTLSDADIRDSIVLRGASVVRVGGISGSVIGRAATVSLAAATSGHRLIVGDHTRVEVAA